MHLVLEMFKMAYLFSLCGADSKTRMQIFHIERPRLISSCKWQSFDCARHAVMGQKLEVLSPCIRTSEVLTETKYKAMLSSPLLPRNNSRRLTLFSAHTCILRESPIPHVLYRHFLVQEKKTRSHTFCNTKAGSASHICSFCSSELGNTGLIRLAQRKKIAIL